MAVNQLLQDTSLGELSFLSIAQAVEHAVPPIEPDARLRIYRNWIAAGGGRGGDGFGAWYNMGVIYSQHGDKNSAILAYRQALVLKPNFNAASVNLGLALEADGSSDAALDVWAGALQPDTDRTVLLNHQGRLLEQLGRLSEAEQMLGRSLGINPAQPDAIQHWVHLRQKMCIWPVLEEAHGLAVKDMLASCGPLGVLALTDDVDIQREVTASWILRKTTACSERLAPEHRYPHERIRIGYLSSDYGKHAMSYLVAEMFERHDREQFDIFGYCSSREDGSDIRRRILASFDHVRMIGSMTDEQAARVIRADEIDVLIDLNGLTAGSRLQIMRWRPAPFQLTYLGFVGPVPLPELDGLICDEFVIPPEQEGSYLPRPLAIAGIYQANDSHRDVAQGLTRDMAGLPLGRFVLCCFCGHFKITAVMFESWLTILYRAPNSVLWLVGDNQWSQASMRRAALAAGIGPERLLFAERCAPEIYMARLGLADLFLDTFPYNAGTVASDAIRMQLPIVTLPGRSFASRMAARLLDVYGATDGIAKDVNTYVDWAVTMATNPFAYQHHRSCFTPEKWDATLGDSAAFGTSLESALLSLVQDQGAAMVSPGGTPP